MATVGTINLDYRCLYLHFKNDLYIDNVKFIENIKKYMMDTITKK